MLSVVIPTLNAEHTLAACLSALVHAAADGMVAPHGAASQMP